MESTINNNFLLKCRGKELDCRPGQSHGAHVMGILNVTPDSFSDGGNYTVLDAARRRVEAMINEGAVIIDIGGESTRPKGETYGAGAAVVDASEEKSRVIPIIEAIHRDFPDILISIDTYKPEVARAALEAGAHIINDVTGLRIFPEMADVARTHQAPLILMHALGQPGEMPQSHIYTDVVEEVRTSISASINIAKAAGVDQIVTDPGFGFGKTVEENLHLLNHVDDFLMLGYPVLVGVSRKSTIGAVLGGADNPTPVAGRLFGTLGATAIAVLRGATIVRTHDVQPTVEFLKSLAETANA